jgi:calcium/calmodulin-dependent protein kinase I
LLLSEKSMDADVVITDFGLSAILEEEPRVYDAVGTPSYLGKLIQCEKFNNENIYSNFFFGKLAPEVLVTLDTNEGYGKEVDLWGVGVILYILFVLFYFLFAHQKNTKLMRLLLFRLCGFPPFYGDDEDEIYDKIEVGEYSFPSPYWDPISADAKDLITRFLTLDPVKRITIEEALEHPWLKGAAPQVKLDQTVEQLVKFNARRKFKVSFNFLAKKLVITNERELFLGCH